MSETTILKASIGKTPYTTIIDAGVHRLIGDEPLDKGGENRGPAPYDFILAALATCTAATLRMYADRKGFALEGVDLELEMEVEKTETGQVTRIERKITLKGELSESEEQRLMDIADKCPVHRLLTNEVQINSILEK